MKHNKSPERVQERIVRAIAFQVVIISILSIVFRLPILTLILGMDFIIRAFINGKYSPLAMISKRILAPALPFRDKIIMLKPKKFAASIGAVLSISAGIFGTMGQSTVMIYIIGILFLFSFLEAFLKFCAGCWLFGILIRLKLIHEDNCPDCELTNVK